MERSFFSLQSEPATIASSILAQANATEPAPSEDSSPEQTNPQETRPRDRPKKLMWWLLGVAGVVAVASGFLYLFLKISRPDAIADELPEEKIEAKPNAIANNIANGGVSNSEVAVAPPETPPENPQHLQVAPDSQKEKSADNAISVPNHSTNHGSLEPPTRTSVEGVLAVEETTRLPKINIVDALIQDLQNPDPAKRRKAIWELGQRGDSRAIQPLVDLMIDSDSSQRSLILAVLSEIGTRTLKPMNRALAVSLQDDSAEVRKNAIRDLTRIYDIVAQMSQLLNHAIDDSDREVSDTAQWALSQLNRIRTLGGRGDFPSLPHAGHPSDRSSAD